MVSETKRLVEGERAVAKPVFERPALGVADGKIVAPVGLPCLEDRHQMRAQHFRGSASLLGASVPVAARVLPRDGAVIVEPQGLPLGTTTLFADPRLRIDRLTAREATPGALRVRLEGTFRS